ncbi:MAG: hypothetical protein HXO13_02230 [Prevotella salivae]|nr:hypothetical protein [Segatella salivae]DAY13806.1 MAG TPA: HigB, HigA-Antitoxin complex, TOXIN.65A [Caudoviricetes sp.]
MSKFETELFDLINNENGFVFYKLLINGKSMFDYFVGRIRASSPEERHLKKIYAYMDSFSKELMPKTKFRNIKCAERKDIFEFKSKNVRVYVIIQEPSVYVVAGGLKASQDKDIKRIVQQIKEFQI